MHSHAGAVGTRSACTQAPQCVSKACHPWHWIPPVHGGMTGLPKLNPKFGSFTMKHMKYFKKLPKCFLYDLHGEMLFLE